MRMKQNGEVVGLLSSIKKENGEITLIFVNTLEIEIPSDAISQNELKEFLGKHIGLFNNSGDYRIRNINKLNKGNINETNQTKEQRKKPSI